MKESNIISKEDLPQQSQLRQRLCHLKISQFLEVKIEMWEHPKRGDKAKGREREREEWQRGNGVFWLIRFERAWSRLQPATRGSIHGTLDRFWGGGADPGWSRGRVTSTFEKKPCAFSLHLLHGAVWGVAISCADAGRAGSFWVHSQAKCAKIPRRERHNKFRLQVRVPAGYKLEKEQLGVDVGGVRECASFRTIWQTEQICSSSPFHF